MNDRIKYSSALITKCEKLIKEVTCNKDVKLSRKPDNKKVIGSFTIHPLWGIPYKDDEDKDRGAIELVKVKTDTIFPTFISLILKFDHEDTQDFLSQAKIYIMVPNGDSYKPIYRADWDYRDFSKEKRHGQPHWHAYGQERVSDAGCLDDARPFNFENQNFKAESKGIVDFSLIHLPMSTNWHEATGKEFVRNIKCDKSLENWLHEIFEYIMAQLAYLRTKHKDLPVQDFLG